jgi:hypothetical protein
MGFLPSSPVDAGYKAFAVLLFLLSCLLKPNVYANRLPERGTRGGHPTAERSDAVGQAG